MRTFVPRCFLRGWSTLRNVQMAEKMQLEYRYLTEAVYTGSSWSWMSNGISYSGAFQRRQSEILRCDSLEILEVGLRKSIECHVDHAKLRQNFQLPLKKNPEDSPKKSIPSQPLPGHLAGSQKPSLLHTRDSDTIRFRHVSSTILPDTQRIATPKIPTRSLSSRLTCVYHLKHAKKRFMPNLCCYSSLLSLTCVVKPEHNRYKVWLFSQRSIQGGIYPSVQQWSNDPISCFPMIPKSVDRIT